MVTRIKCWAFVLIAFPLIVAAQDKVEISQEHWFDIVDYVNAKATYQYLFDLSNNAPKGLSTKDLKVFQKTVAPELESVQLEEPFYSFDDLERLLSENNFSQTLDGLSRKIEDLKSEKLVLDEFYEKVKLVFTNKNAVNEFDYQQIDEDINDYIKSTVLDTEPENGIGNINNEQEAAPDSPSELEHDNELADTPDSMAPDRKSNLNWLILLSVLIASFLAVLFKLFTDNKKLKKSITLLKSQPKKNDANNKKVKDINKRKMDAYRDELEQLREENTRLKAKIQELGRELAECKKLMSSEQQPPKQKQSAKTFYATKLSADGFFEDISDAKDVQSVFELTTLSSNSKTASFKVVIASDYMEKNIMNFPDMYLGGACVFENRTQSTSKGVETVKEGRAELVDGRWLVKEENKARIKFV